MNLRFILLWLLVAAGAAAQTPPGVPASTNIGGAEYPRVLPDNRVVFRIKAPKAQSVAFRTDKLYPASRDADGAWTATTDPQVPGFHYYWLVIDDVQVADPASETFYGTGRQTSGIEVPEAGGQGAYYAEGDVPRGDIRERWYHSKITGAWRRLYVYAPPGYDESRDRYPVLYLQHGAGEDERAWVTQGRVGPILDNLIASGAARPMLVVVAQGYARRPGEPEVAAPPPPAPGSGSAAPAPDLAKRFGTFEDVLVQEVVPLVDATYRTLPDRNDRAIAGFSMGGAQAFVIGLRHLDAFASIGGLSGGGGGFGSGTIDPKTYLGGVFADAGAFNSRVRLVFLGLGTEEPARIHTSVLGYHNSLTAAGIIHVFYESPGTSHEWLTERRNLRELVSRLFR